MATMRPIPGLGAGFYEAGPLPWGETMPLLKIARHYGVDYAVTLALADNMQHGRPLTPYVWELGRAVERDTMASIIQDVRYLSAYVMEQRAQYKAPTP